MPMRLLFEDLDAFYTEHRGCGDLDADVGEAGQNILHISMRCSCGGTIRRVEPTGYGVGRPGEAGERR
jgi:hypothetical protein